jgi:hypothetical protein
LDTLERVPYRQRLTVLPQPLSGYAARNKGDWKWWTGAACPDTLYAIMKLLHSSRRLVLQFCGVIAACVALAACQAAPPVGATNTTASGQGESSPDTFSFITAGDMRSFVGPAPAGKRYFDGVCEAARAVGAGAFMISPGDCDPPSGVRATIDRYLGTNYLWYPVIGNHELGSAANMTWLRQWAKAGIPHLVRRGPPGAEDTSYSFDFGNSHFIAMNDYYDGRSDTTRKNDIPEAQFQWLEQDLAANHQPFVWVIGHKPIKSLPDMDNAKVRHAGESVSTNAAHLHRFLQLLKDHHVRAYICGHTHSTSVEKVNGIWQADSGHARGAGNGDGARSTFLKFRVSGTQAWVDIYRGDAKGVTYQLRKTVELD